MEFNDRLRYLRNENKTTQEQLAKYLGVGRPTIAGYETKGKQPSFEILDKIADYFNVSVDYLLGRTDIKESTSYIPKEIKKGDSNSDYLSEEIQDLSPESQEEIKKLIELYKIRDMQKRNTEVSDELTNLD